jgi:hypothetical protein
MRFEIALQKNSPRCGLGRKTGNSTEQVKNEIKRDAAVCVEF